MIITSIGKAGKYQKTCYVFQERKCSGCFSTLVLAQLLDIPKEEKILLLVTPETTQFCPNLQNKFDQYGYHNLEMVSIPNAEDEESIFQIVLILTKIVKEGERVILDVTHSFRSLPFVYFVSILFLRAFKNVSIEGIYYGAFEEGRESNPIIDLTPLFSMAFWFHAVQTFRETGSVQPLWEIACRESSRIFQRETNKEVGYKLSHLKEPLQKLSLSTSFCLPLEMGMDVNHLLQKMDFKSDKSSFENLLALVFREISEELADFTIKLNEKNQIQLSTDELFREYKIAEWYSRHGNPDHCLIILGELMINWLIKTRNMGNWLEYNTTRERARRILNGMSNRSREGIGPDNVLKEIGDLWSSIGNQRNEFAHAGFKDQIIGIKGKKDKVNELCSKVACLLKEDLIHTFPLNERKKLLIVPFGLSPGVLYSAALLSRFDDLLIVFSKETQPLLLTALDEIRKSKKILDQNIFIFLLDDAHTDFIPLNQLKNHKVESLNGKQSSIDHFLSEYDCIEGCITGGTTAMQYIIERLLNIAQSYGVFNLKRFALIDKRSIEDQKTNPFVLGEKFLLDQQM
ncbi:MAG: TIGR02221 family CRISPR-associated protein [Candidatus Atribacteria bacterium]|nr:TIGR02221 family CRISPR-associated protein [Candidatus Atribacteria bacterium]